MRYNIDKKKSTKPERIIYEVLKELKIPFRHRWIIQGSEVDFLIGEKICLEVDGHEQDGVRNHKLANLGYIPIHVNNKDVDRDYIINLLKIINV